MWWRPASVVRLASPWSEGVGEETCVRMQQGQVEMQAVLRTAMGLLRVFSADVSECVVRRAAAMSHDFLVQIQALPVVTVEPHASLLNFKLQNLFNKYLFKCQGLGVGPKQEKVFHGFTFLLGSYEF